MASLFYFPVSLAISARQRWNRRAAVRVEHAQGARTQRRFLSLPSTKSLRGFLKFVPTHLKGKYAQLTAVTVTTALFAVTIWFSRLTFLPENSSTASSHLHFGSGLAILRALQGATSTCTTFSVAQSLEVLGWTATRNFGLLVPTFLSLSPTTSVLGLLQLGVSCNSRWIDKFWSFLRIVFMLSTWVAGIALFINTSFGTTFEPSLTFNVTAGTGTFDGTFVAPTIASVNGSLSYWILATTSTFLDNPQFSSKVGPVLCSTNDMSCESYLLPGGLQSMSPNPPSSNADPIVLVHDAPASQVEFAVGLDENYEFDRSDCVVYGDDRYIVGLQMCLAPSSMINGSMNAAVFVCSTGTLNGQCRGLGPRLNVSTTMSIFSRQAVVACARSNNSILSISSLSIPTQSPLIDISDFQLALGWLLDYTAAELPPVSSLAFLFWNRNSGLSEHDWAVEALKTLNSILAFTAWFFTANNFGNPQMANPNASFNAQSEEDFLPDRFHTTASTAKPSVRFIIDRRMFVVYIVLQALPILFCWVVLSWRIIGNLQGVKTSSFPLLDFIFKAERRESALSKTNGKEMKAKEIPTSVVKRKFQLQKAGDREFIRELRDVEVSSSS